MKKRKIYKLIIFIFICCLLLIISNNEDDNIRIRVIANSNTSYDQTIKTNIVNVVTKYVLPDYKEEDIKEVLPLLEEELEKYEIMYNTSISIDFGFTDFPIKQLNDKIIPGGTYYTLLVTIGKGEGNNYWTLLYPEYFGITFEEIYSGEVEIKWYFYEKIKNLI